MVQQQLHDFLIEISKKSSRFETKRNYISLSNIIKPVEELINDYKNGYSLDDAGLLKCRMGYWMEQGLKERLFQIDGVTEGPELEYPGSNGLIKGHPDFAYNDLPGDCKSFLLDEHLPSSYKVPQKIYWQMNAYMICAAKSTAILVCESRQSGLIKTLAIKRNDAVCNAIHEKCRGLIAWNEYKF